jgi:hypothetical protein
VVIPIYLIYLQIFCETVSIHKQYMECSCEAKLIQVNIAETYIGVSRMNIEYTCIKNSHKLRTSHKECAPLAHSSNESRFA